MLLQTTKPDYRCVVRLRTSYWNDKNGLHCKKSLTILRRQCIGDFNPLNEEINAVGAEDAILIITNFNECEDGIYEVVPCNETRDWESGRIDSYDLRLDPYTPPSKSAQGTECR